jgi:hypothetical protein
MRTFARPGSAILALVLGAAVACGDSTSPKQATLSPEEARNVASALFSEIARAAGSPTPASANSGASQSIAGGPTVSFSLNATCSAGGSLKGTFEFTDEANAQGTGKKSGVISVTANECNVNTGERMIAANGGYTYNFSASFTNHVLSSNFVWDAGGTLTWTGGSCTLDYTIEVTPQGRTMLSGTVCGVDVSGEAR